MSKAALHKELLTFTNDQLVEVILSAYSSSKEAKAYFEFFLNPDVEALFDKKSDIIAKELNRVKWGRCKGRISVIRAAIRDFEAYGVGADATGRLMLAAIRMLAGQNRWYSYPETLHKGCLKLVADYISLADRNGFASEAAYNIRCLAADSERSSAFMRGQIQLALDRAIADIANKG